MYIAPSQTLRSLALSATVAVVFLFGFRLILRDWTRAGLLSSLMAVLFFSFGHVAMGLDAWSNGGEGRFEESALGVGWLLAFLALSLAIVHARWPRLATGMLNLVSGLLFVVPAVVTLGFALDGNGPSAREDQILARFRGDAAAQLESVTDPSIETPDIYYIILDGYERADVLLESYGYDNSGFLDGLGQRGFYVADQSRANYLSTNYSLSSSLNLVYFRDLPPGILRAARYSLRVNFVTEFLHQHGYRIVVFDSGTRDTNNQYADLFLAPEAPSPTRAPDVNPFEVLLLRTTMARLLVGRGGNSGSDAPAVDTVQDTANRELAARRNRINYTFSHLADFAASPGADFVFAHIYAPHIPFLYGPSGQALQYQGDLNVNWYVVRPERYVEYYGYQVEQLNRTILAAIDTIQRNAARPQVIILQADHGDDFLLDWENPTAAGVGARSAILNAIYFSDLTYDMLYPSISPVNTFRIVFDKWFATRYGLLPDRTYYHKHPVFTTYGSRLEFQDSCISFGICAPNHGT